MGIRRRRRVFRLLLSDVRGRPRASTAMLGRPGNTHLWRGQRPVATKIRHAGQEAHREFRTIVFHHFLGKCSHEGVRAHRGIPTTTAPSSSVVITRTPINSAFLRAVDLWPIGGNAAVFDSFRATPTFRNFSLVNVTACVVSRLVSMQ